MKQMVVLKPNIIRFREVALPDSLKFNEVLLRIKNIGICGSDVHVYHGEHPAVIYPVTQGHEYAAIVEAVGDKVSKITPGMKVTARPQQVCGKCGACVRGEYNICDNLKVEGFQAPGAGQELFIVPEDRVIHLPDTMSFEFGAMVEPTAVAMHACRRVSTLKGKNVVISGAGTIGNLVAQTAKNCGAKKVAIADISEYRLKIARECGITDTINVKEQSFEEEIFNIFRSDGFQVGLEAAGVRSSIDTLMKNIQKGGEIIVIAVYAHNPEINMYYLGEHELTLKGTLMYLHEDYLRAVDAISSRQINLFPLISKHFPFVDFKEAYEFIEEKKDGVMKVIIDM